MLSAIRQCMKLALNLTDEQTQVIGPDTTPRDLEVWDSVGHVALIVELEQHFGVVFNDAEVVDLTSVAAIEEALRHKGVEGLGGTDGEH